MTKPKGYFDYFLSVDCETSGMAFNEDDPSINTKTGQVYQSVSWGLVVVDATTLKTVEELYIEIKWDGESEWDKRAENVHGLSLAYLEENGMTSEEAVVAIAGLILKYWGPDVPVCLAGHNVQTFDMFFLKRLLRSQGIEIKFGNRHICTNTLGATVWKTFNSDDLFDIVGYPHRNTHNALDDARAVLHTLQVTRRLWESLVEPHI